jgi:hypothetical protein
MKTKLQNGNFPSMKHCFKEIWGTDGLGGFYRGLRPNLIGIIPEKAIKLAVNDYCREYFGKTLGRHPDTIPIQYGMLSGSIAGLCQVIITNPMEIVKIRLQLKDPKAAKYSLTTLVRDMGFKGLYKGTLATLARDVPFSLIFFASVSYFRELATPPGTKSSFPVIFTSGILSGAVAAALVTPMDVIKTKLQVQDSQYKTQMECYR